MPKEVLKARTLFGFVFLLCCFFLGCKKKDISYTSLVSETLFENISVKTYGGSKNDAANAVFPTNDGGFMVSGYTQSTDGDISQKENEGFDFWLLKFDLSGNLEWEKALGSTFNEKSISAVQTSDSGYVVLGSFDERAQHETKNDFWVVQTDATGTILWEKLFGYQGVDTATALLQTNDSGSLLAGVLDVTASGGAGNNVAEKRSKRHAGGDYWLIKLAANGDFQWSHYYGGSFTDTPSSIAATSDGGFLIVGTSDSTDVDISSNKGTYDIWVVKISSEGALEWEQSFGGSQIDQAFGIAPTSDGNFLIVGDTRSSDGDVSDNKGASDVWVLKISPQGNLLWEKTFGGSNFDSAKAVYSASDGGFFIAGHSRSSEGDLTVNNGQNDVWILKTDAEGELLYQKSLGGTGIDLANALVELENGSLVVVGESESADNDILENKGFKDVLIINLSNSNRTQ